MLAAQFNMDVVSQAVELLPSYKLIVPDFVIQELENIKRKSNGKAKTASTIALKIAFSDQLMVKVVPLLEKENVDDALLRISNVLCTNDKELRIRARKRGITVIYLRQRKYLAVDGHLKL